MRTIEILGKEVIPELDKRDRERNGKAEAAPARARRADDLEAAKGLID
jgi:hypothetical protein